MRGPYLLMGPNDPMWEDQAPIWEESKDFGSGVRLYRCMDISRSLGQSLFEYWNKRLGEWRRVNRYDIREAMHRYTTENFRDPF